MRLNSAVAVFIIKVSLALFVIFRVFSVDIFPVSTPDSVNYLSYAKSGYYLVDPVINIKPASYKTYGYPLYLTVLYRF